MAHHLIIIGCGGHAKVVYDIATLNDYQAISFIDTTGSAKDFLERPVKDAIPMNYNGHFIVAVGDNHARQCVYHSFQKANPQAVSPALVHPSSVVSSSCTIGAGTVVMPLCILNAGTRVDTGVIINSRSSIDHDCTLMDFCSTAPGCTLGGSVMVGERSAICIATTVIHNIRIGNDAVVGAKSLVLHDIADNILAHGIPAEPRRRREPGDPYL